MNCRDYDVDFRPQPELLFLTDHIPNIVYGEVNSETFRFFSLSDNAHFYKPSSDSKINYEAIL